MEEQFQRNGGCDGRNNNQQDDGGKVDRIYHADRQALLGDDQGDLTAGHHANADLERVGPVEAADLGSTAAADNLCQQGNDDEANAEQQDLRGQAADVGFQADAGEEHRGEDNIVADVDAALNVGGIVHGAQHNAGNVGTGDVGNTKELLGNIGHGKAESDTDNGDALGVGVAFVQPFHGIVNDHTDTDRNQEEQHRVDEHSAQACTGTGAGANDAGQHDDTDDVIDNGSTDDRGTKEAFQLPQLLQGGHRDGNAGGGHDRADEECAVELWAADLPQAKEGTIQQRAAYQRYKHADASDQRSDGACTQQLFQVGAKAGGEHQQHNANLGKDRDRVADLHEVQQAGTDEQTGENLTDDLGRLTFTGDQTAKFST